MASASDETVGGRIAAPLHSGLQYFVALNGLLLPAACEDSATTYSRALKESCRRFHLLKPCKLFLIPEGYADGVVILDTGHSEPSPFKVNQQQGLPGIGSFILPCW